MPEMKNVLIMGNKNAIQKYNEKTIKDKWAN